ncbi:hypothetical protein [Maritimibacter sp. UBA3975]|uniref:hypothetical protein n=1 Tax=Maritimibacter sp. UBA3975 TaxID=1946833 RepID=UPI000C08FAF7|nr:hypothetical protein [Maritimibacter sp. UBA3975]MAM60859.1 hypothetical protein [Maritimibacter sp.]|tara:strand:+ start:13148 stop:13369 length:222 start_codon:yes stop_codon:yes gene_type:complete
MNIVPIDKDVDADTVDLIETVLAMAKRGELRDVVVVGAVNDEDGTGFYRAASFSDRWRILGALEYAKEGVHRG